MLVFAVVCLLAGSLAWLRASPPPVAAPDSAGADAALAGFESADRATVQLNLAALYAGRRDLPKAHAWHAQTCAALPTAARAR